MRAWKSARPKVGSAAGAATGAEAARKRETYYDAAVLDDGTLWCPNQ